MYRNITLFVSAALFFAVGWLSNRFITPKRADAPYVDADDTHPTVLEGPVSSVIFDARATGTFADPATKTSIMVVGPTFAGSTFGESLVFYSSPFAVLTGDNLLLYDRYSPDRYYSVRRENLKGIMWLNR